MSTRVILHVEKAGDLSLALHAFISASQDENSRATMTKPGGLVGVKIGNDYFSIHTNKRSFTVRRSA